MSHLSLYLLGDGTHRQLTNPDAADAGSIDDDIDDYNDDDADKPIFLPAPRNITVSPGDRASLKCRVDNLGTKTVHRPIDVRLQRYTHVIISTHAGRRGVDISFTVCVCLFTVQLRISPPRIKLAASHFALRLTGIQGRESYIFELCSPEDQNRTNRRVRKPRPPECKHWRRDAPFVKYRAACGRRIGMCG